MKYKKDTKQNFLSGLWRLSILNNFYLYLNIYRVYAKYYNDYSYLYLGKNEKQL